MAPTPLVSAVLALGLLLAPWSAPEAATRLVPYSTQNEADPNGHIDTGLTAASGLCGFSNLSGGVPGTGAGGADPAGCFTRFGGLCSAEPKEVCDLALVPAGRCTKGTGACVWPQGAGTCVDDPDIACLPDDTAKHGDTAGTFKSSMCRDANPSADDLCDMTTNTPACACQGTDPTLGDWEGTICGNVVQSVCSDGDPLRGFGGVATGGGLCVDINLVGGSETIAGCGASNTSPGFLANVKYSPENPPGNTTPNRRPGTALTTPNEGGPIRDGTATSISEIDEYGTGFYAKFGVRQIHGHGESFHGDAGFTAGAVTGGFDANLLLFACNAPRLWAVNRPIEGVCDNVGSCGTSTICGRNPDCTACGGFGTACLFTPGASTTKYCHEAPFTGSSFIWTRDLTSAEHTLVQTAPTCTLSVCVGGGFDGESCTTAADCGTSSCPPSCGNSYDFHTGEHAQISAALDDFPAPDGERGAIQLALDNLEGQRMGRGGYVAVGAVVSMSWVSVGDNSCFIGGNPDAVNSVCSGTCDSGICDVGGTDVCIGGTNSGAACTQDLDCGECDTGFLVGDSCVADADCERCGDGVSECDSAASLDCSEMIGQCDDSTGRGCDPFKGGATGGCGGSACRVCGGTPATQPTDLAVGGSGAWFDPVNGSDSPPLPIGYDTHGFAELDLVGRISVLGDVGGTVRIPILGVGTNHFARGEMRDDGTPGLFDDDTLAPGSNAPNGIGTAGSFPVGSRFNSDPTGPASTDLVSWASESSTGFVPNTLNDFGPGADGLPGCIGDNFAAVPGSCDPVANGADDEATLADFTLNLTGSTGGAACTGVGVPHAGCKEAVRARFLMSDPTRLAPILHSTTATTLRDATLFGLSQNLDVMTKGLGTSCPIIGTCDISGNDCVDTSDCPGGEVCSARETRCAQKVYCEDEGLDADGDQLCASVDNCPNHANADQADTDSVGGGPDGIGDVCDPCASYDNSGVGGLADASGDGIPNVCQCGDPNLNNLIDSNDLSTIFGCLTTAIPPATCTGVILGSGKGDANGNNLLDSNDLSQIFGVLTTAVPSYALTCTNRPEGTPVP